MTPTVAAATASTLSAAAVISAQQVVQGDANSSLFTILGIGSAVIGWLVRREAQERKLENEHRRADLEHRRTTDIRRDAELVEARALYESERDHNRELYERLVQLAHITDQPPGGPT